MNNIDVSVKKGAAFKFTNTDNVILSNVKSLVPLNNEALILLDNCTGFFINNCFPASGTGIFIKATGAKTSNVLAKCNFLLNVSKPLDIDKSINSKSVTLAD